MDDVTEVVQEMRQEGLIADPEAPTSPKVAEFQPAAVAQQALAQATQVAEASVQDGRIAETLLSIAERLKQVDEQMREQERRLDQILADGQLSVRNIGKG